MSNPYTWVFGQSPVEIIERTSQAERIVSEFTQERPSNCLNLVTGIRGSGKTVFVTQIAKRLGERREWEVVNLNPQRDLLTSFAAKLSSNKALGRGFRESGISLQAFGFGIGVQGADPIYDIEEALVRMLRDVRKRGKRVLVTIDEAVNSKDMRIFASSYQIFLREDLPVFLLMTGLHKNLDSLRNADGMTFLERAPRTALRPLDLDGVRANYESTLGVGQAEATRLASQTKGYPFAFQTIGYFCWENPQSHDVALRDAQRYLCEFAYEKIWSELSANDRRVVQALASSPHGEVAEVRRRLGYTSDQFSPYRSRLLKAGVVTSPANGLLEFTLPWFGDYALRA